jgi:hypothetical protein
MIWDEVMLFSDEQYEISRSLVFRAIFVYERCLSKDSATSQGQRQTHRKLRTTGRHNASDESKVGNGKLHVGKDNKTLTSKDCVLSFAEGMLVAN